MPCCLPYIQSFFNKESTEIFYPQALQDLYGKVPKVQVLYWDGEAGEYYVSNNFTRAEFTGDKVIVSHGGVSSGIVKIY